MVDYQYLETQLTPVTDQVVHCLGLELVRLEFRREKNGLVLRVFIDKEEGVHIKDCQAVSEELSTVLLGEGFADLIPGPYHLEVSSPGVERQLVRESDYLRSLGREVMVAVGKVSGTRSKIRGVIAAFTGEELVLRREDSEKVIPVEDIISAHIVFDWRAALKSREPEAKRKRKARRRKSRSRYAGSGGDKDV